jgi:hypothetical protein
MTSDTGGLVEDGPHSIPDLLCLLEVGLPLVEQGKVRCRKARKRVAERRRRGRRTGPSVGSGARAAIDTSGMRASALIAGIGCSGLRL